MWGVSIVLRWILLVGLGRSAIWVGLLLIWTIGVECPWHGGPILLVGHRHPRLLGGVGKGAWSLSAPIWVGGLGGCSSIRVGLGGGGSSRGAGIGV